MIKIIQNEIKSLLKFFISYFPGKIGCKLRELIYKKLFSSLGKNFNTEIGISINCPKNMHIGNNISIMKYSSLNSYEGKIYIGDNLSTNQNVDINASNGGEIIIGNDVMIGNNVVIRAADHVYKNISNTFLDAGHEGGKIIIENNVWIGANSVILRGVKISEGSVIGAGTVVKKNVGPRELVISNFPQINKKINL